MSSVPEMVERAQDALTVKRVYGEPYEKDGVTIIPAAQITGGGGAGTGEGEQGKGSGGGYGLIAKPAGALIIKDGQVSWMGAVDVNRAILGGQFVAMVALLTLRSIFRASRRRRGMRRLTDVHESNEGGRVARVITMARRRAH
jgi:uncharacterized spore protein YtfJ